MYGIGTMEIAVIAAIVLLIWGPRQIPRLGKAMGETIREFGKAGQELRSLHRDDDEDEAA